MHEQLIFDEAEPPAVVLQPEARDTPFVFLHGDVTGAGWYCRRLAPLIGANVPMIVGVVLGTLLMLLVGFISSQPFVSISDWFLAATIPLAVLSLPVLHFSGVWPNTLLCLIPTHGPLLLLGVAFDQVTLMPWQVGYAVLCPTAWVAALYLAASAGFVRYIISRSAAP